jgi:hypothetical protein
VNGTTKVTVRSGKACTASAVATNKRLSQVVSDAALHGGL